MYKDMDVDVDALLETRVFDETDDAIDDFEQPTATLSPHLVAEAFAATDEPEETVQTLKTVPLTAKALRAEQMGRAGTARLAIGSQVGLVTDTRPEDETQNHRRLRSVEFPLQPRAKETSPPPLAEGSAVDHLDDDAGAYDNIDADESREVHSRASTSTDIIVLAKPELTPVAKVLCRLASWIMCLATVLGALILAPRLAVEPLTATMGLSFFVLIFSGALCSTRSYAPLAAFFGVAMALFGALPAIAHADAIAFASFCTALGLFFITRPFRYSSVPTIGAEKEPL
jgi:hypothetical protein